MKDEIKTKAFSFILHLSSFILSEFILSEFPCKKGVIIDSDRGVM
jgi:hypothetical protein